MSDPVPVQVRPPGLTLVAPPLFVERVARRGLESTTRELIVARARMQARAVLAADALEVSATFSALEAVMMQVAPLGEARYKLIGDQLAVSAARAIARL